ncbi:MAG TPA: ATP-dependent helicase [Candidatus Limnocylindrales bacterium]|nr:ATP-dependent helicase [Candidatus Limnocylindrales bacterium]
MPLHPAVADRLAALAQDQRAAATAPPGPVLCVAPAGSGKTTTLVARVAWRIARGADPATVCAVTFNRRAAEELAVRLDAALVPLGLAPGAVRVRTFHALGREILADAGEAVEPLVDRRTLLGELFEGLSAAEERRLDDTLSRLKLELGVDTVRLRAEVAAERAAGRPPSSLVEAFLAYEAALAKRGELDFDDLVRRALRALEADGALLDRWRARARILLMDEVQDVDRSQLRLALLLAAPGNDVFLVGDDDQTIYAWRLADVRRVLDLASHLPGLRRVDLTANHRCPPAVTRRAARLVAHNRERFAKRIEPGPRTAGSLHLAPDPGDEPARARRLFAAWRLAEGGETIAPGSFAVLARTNAELAPYAALALDLGVPYAAAEDGLLLDAPAIDALLDAAVRIADARPGTGVLAALAEAREEADEADDAVAGALLAWAAGAPDLAALRAAIDRARARRAALRREDAPLVLATAHATKGLEFDHVACVGLDEGRFPSARSLAEAGDPARVLEEERRLAYVAWTRARRSLALVYDPGAPSPFMQEAFEPQELGC